MTITKVIKALYVKLGGSLTDTISGIAGGAPVADYTVISDCIKALYVLYGGDLSEVYSGISDVAVKDYTSVSKALAALAKVAFKGITVNESYDISEGKLNTATVTLEGDVIAHIPDGVVTIGKTAFKNNVTITKVIMPDSVTTIEDGNYYGSDADGAFYNCSKLKNVEFSNNLINIGDYAFKSCTSLTSITIPDSVTSIGSSVFYDCTSLTSITIPDSVTSIGSSVFYDCTSLTSITIPDSVTTIGDGAFYDCTSLTDIYYTGTQAEWEQIATGIAAIPEGVTIHYEYTPS